MLNNIEIVEIINNQPITNSLKIAEVFNKRHADVLNSVKSLKCSEEFTKRNFSLSEYSDTTGKSNPMYNITKDGFVFLVMGYTGEKACRFKEAYINAFNQMEQQLKHQQSCITDNKLFNDLANLLKDKECLLTWQDLVNISHKKSVKEICNYLTVKSLSERGNILNIVNALENQQEFLRLQY